MRLPVLFIISITSALLAGCGGGGSGASTFSNGHPTQPVGFAGHPPLVPAQGIYVGAFANTSSVSDEQSLANLESQIGRTFALSMHYDGWKTTFSALDLALDAQAGRIPVISWNCGVSNAQVASGEQDANIEAHADALRAYGHPVFLRYQWEMNFPAASNNRIGCYDPHTDDANDVFSPTEFTAAWQHIHAVFVARGATNVAFLWNPGGAGPVEANLYYPGDASVDWVGIDEYDRNDEPFADVFSLYSQVVGHRKPILIAESGASAAYQPQYFSGAVAALKTQFPAVKGFMYFDAAGKDNWRLTPAGIAAFGAVANDPYLSAR